MLAIKAKSLAPAAKDAILRLRRPLFDRPKSFEQIAGIGVSRKGFEMEVFAHRLFFSPETFMRTAAPRVADLPV